MLYGVQYCNHANEVPNSCPCNQYCYCRYEGSCQPRREWMFCGHPQIPANPCPCDDQCICRLAGNCADQGWRLSDACPECRAKPGSAVLCPACSMRCQIFGERQATYKKAKKPTVTLARNADTDPLPSDVRVADVDATVSGTAWSTLFMKGLAAQTAEMVDRTKAFSSTPSRRLAEIWCTLNGGKVPEELEAFSTLFPNEQWHALSTKLWEHLNNCMPGVKEAGIALWRERFDKDLDPATGEPLVKPLMTVPEVESAPVRVYDFEEE